MAAIIYCWQQQQQRVRGRTAQLLDISSGATWVADLDSGALALTKEASGNHRGVCVWCAVVSGWCGGGVVGGGGGCHVVW